MENHFLEVTVDGEKFERKMNLNMNLKKYSVFIQTDKAIYKPSENIQFRVLLLNIDTKPYESSNVQIFITDGALNRIKQFTNPKFSKGVFEGELQLSDSPVMGNWIIHVKVDDGEVVKKDFEVAEYVLPKFEVIVEANPHVAFDEGKIRVTVSGKYTFGKLAKGKATVTAKVMKHGFHGRKKKNQEMVKIVDIDGKKDVEFDIKDELNIIKIDDDEIIEIDEDEIIDIKATLVEELSGKEHSGSTKVTIHKRPHTIEIVKSSEKIKPGLPYSVTAFVKTHNGIPVLSDEKNPVEFAVTLYHHEEFHGYASAYREELERKFVKVPLENGAAKLSINVPKNVTRVEIDAIYLKTSEKIYNILKVESESEQYIQLEVSPKR